MARIIVADDSKMSLTFYAHILDYLGHEAVLCSDGREALEKFHELPADLIILDVEMPGMNGIEVCREIRRDPGSVKIPIIIVSAHEEEKDIMNGLNAGADDYLVKPVKETHLIAKLKTFLHTSALHKKDIDLVKNQTVFAGRFKIEKLIGYGSHSIVFKSLDTENGNIPAAVKILNETVISEELSEVFIDTAKKIQRIDSANIIKIIDYGRYGQELYLILEYAPEGDLAGKLKPGPMSELEAAKMLLDIVNALDALSKKGIVHLDIKPENILYDGKHFKLTDFGFTASVSGATIPVQREVWGTVSYMAPEALTGEYEISEKTDIYSLGVTVYRALTGDNPFEAEKAAVSMFRQLNSEPISIKAFNKKLSPALADIIDFMLSKAPDERPSLEELLFTLPQLIEMLESKAEKEKREEKIAETKKSKEIKEAIEKGREPGIEKDTEFSEKKISSEIQRMKKRIRKIKRKKSASTRNVFLRILLVSAAILISVNVGAFCYKFISSEPPTPPRGALTVIMGLKSGEKEEKRIYDIRKARLSESGEKAGYAYKCLGCGKEFPVADIPATANSRKDYLRILEDHYKCPYCGSYRIEPVLTIAEKNRLNP